MKIAKLYFDCVTPGGQAFIGYAASLGLGPLRLPWSASRLWGEGAELRQGFYRHHVSSAADALRLSLPRQEVRGEWGASAPCPPLLLVADRDLEITWQVLRPRVAASLRSGLSAYDGAGYVERLELRLRRPRLPFRRLYWGRFFPDRGGYCIWTGWRGGLERSWVLTDKAEPARRAEFSDYGLSFGGNEIVLEPRRTLTDAPISGHFPEMVGKAVGGGLVAGTERKFLSRGEWRKPSGEALTGWALHETVVW